MIYVDTGCLRHMFRLGRWAPDFAAQVLKQVMAQAFRACLRIGVHVYVCVCVPMLVMVIWFNSIVRMEIQNSNHCASISFVLSEEGKKPTLDWMASGGQNSSLPLDDPITRLDPIPLRMGKRRVEKQPAKS